MRLAILAILSLVVDAARAAPDPTPGQPAGRAPAAKGFLSVADFLPKGYAKDGSVSYQKELQQAIDAAARDGRTLIVPAGVYRIDESGLQLRSHLTLWLYGAVFRLDPACKKDGQAFAGHDVSDVQLLGGEIAGCNDVWPEGVNIRGVYLTGKSARVRIRDGYYHDLSSNGIGVFGGPKDPARDLWVVDVVIAHCCNRYGDYSSQKPGPEKGSVREDQGLVTFYHVHDFLVRGCRLEKSRSDGTHFYRCRQGQFVHNKVYSAQMGGYFVESCDDVLASDNIIRDNGSRGVTIERGSRNCTLNGCVVVNSGREGLWVPNCTGLIVTGNVFERNGRKPNGKKANHVWNANVTINGDPTDPTQSATEDYLIRGNLFYTTADQVAAIRVHAPEVKGIVIRDNVLRGENRRVLVEGDAAGRVTLRDNE